MLINIGGVADKIGMLRLRTVPPDSYKQVLTKNSRKLAQGEDLILL